MAITTLYSTNDSMQRSGQSEPNAFECAFALAVSDDRAEYCISVINFREILNRSSYAVFDRAVPTRRSLAINKNAPPAIA